jgi:hypothetical protein
VTLQDTAIQPTTVVRILRIQLDSKLRWKAQEKAIQAKMNTQMLALQRTTTSTWGATMPKARQVYQAVIRSALSYGVSIWHQPSLGKPKGLVVRLQKYQNQGLRTVLGAYRATPARMLEVVRTMRSCNWALYRPWVVRTIHRRYEFHMVRNRTLSYSCPQQDGRRC